MAYLSGKFIWAQDHQGMTGWIPECMVADDTYTTGLGLIVAHDTLEHFAFNSSPEHECEAIGSYLYLRLMTGSITGAHQGGGSVEYKDGLSRSFVDVFRDSNAHDLPDIRTPVSKHINDTIDEGLREATIDAFLQSYRDTDDYKPETTSDSDWFAYRKQWAENAWRWMTRGYLKAIRRWEGRGSLQMAYPQYSAAELFWEIVEDINQNHGENADIVEGTRMQLHVNALRRTYTIRRDGYRPE